MPRTPTPSTHATLAVITDRVERYREDVARLVEALSLERNAELISAIYEAERTLRAAGRSLRRAAKLSE